jgi:hypothetical protein
LTIRPPTDYPLLEKWNEQIKRDTVLITVEANLKRIRSVMQRNNLKLTPYVTVSGADIAERSQAIVSSGYTVSGPNASRLMWAASAGYEFICVVLTLASIMVLQGGREPCQGDRGAQGSGAPSKIG